MNWKRDFNWDLAIKRNSEALQGIIAALFVMLGDVTLARIPKPLHSAVLRVLRPAESAVRRLIVIAARGVVVKLAPSRPMPKGQMIGKGGGVRISFQFYDTRKYFPELSQRRTKYTKIRRVSMSTPMLPCDQHPSLPPFPRRRPMAWSMRSASAGGSKLSRQPLMICLVRPGAWPAGGWDGRTCQARSSNHHSGRVLRPAAARGIFIPSMKSSPTATGSPGRR